MNEPVKLNNKLLGVVSFL